MAQERLAVRKLREVLRLRFASKLSTRNIATSLGIGNGTVCEYLGRARVAGVGDWPLPPELDDDAALTALLFPAEGKGVAHRPEPDWAQVHRELKRKGVTKLLLWEEYLAANPGGYQYSQFCERYGRWQSVLGVTMRQEHRAGEKLFVDFSGDGVEVVERDTGEVRVAKLFVATLGASSYTYVEPVYSEDLATWVGCHVRAMAFFGGTPALVVPDNLKSGVTHVHRYEPEENPTYADLARHYGFAILPARPRRPRDKAKVEAAVLVAQRWILAVLRNHRFGGLHEVREAVRPLLEKLNGRPMRHVGRSRRQLYEELEKPVLKALPVHAYELAFWKKARVHPDYHVEVEGHLYSVPYSLAHKQVEARYTEGSVEVFLGGRRVASHVRKHAKGYTTLKEHMPASHRAHAEWTPTRLLTWAEKTGPSTAALVQGLMERKPHPEQGFRGALGVMRLKDKYGEARLEKACARAVRHRAYSYKSVAAILQHHLEDAREEREEKPPLPAHENVRGPHYYH
ncbi:transposase, IS21 family [Myxococcus xanthus DK 1622]|uniref:Transposase, IS21 family n=1 Tax=Myxococcus xanthus (strain DK1622) TaxID=246197 RepID=Q1CYW1_MYXXD|nr:MULTISPECIES: IS21 family transposase [Myxococcus]ABF87668.1 transposase, IS21 family [Myxococcus xanthus DK 1622]ABF91769.1 transposase, IS21 family [Myxococcus xanthus DK 1622]ABF92012.1 transposase, IS21 family [Myxococcus xanthus DK 1622]NOJ58209.1 IS21 family transposase [Myxococcus xanthus]QPM78650.1 IS21 family transposase [Myxococcus xanthus]